MASALIAYLLHQLSAGSETGRTINLPASLRGKMKSDDISLYRALGAYGARITIRRFPGLVGDSTTFPSLRRSVPGPVRRVWGKALDGARLLRWVILLSSISAIAAVPDQWGHWLDAISRRA